MLTHTNLISESILVNDTIQLLQSNGGRADVMQVIDDVMNIGEAEPFLAKTLVADLVGSDPRLQFIDDEFIEFVGYDFESQSIAEMDYVVIDLETTGTKCAQNRVTEIGAYRVENGQITEEFQTLINPETPIPIFITELTGISDAMVADAPRFRDIASDLLNFIDDAVIIAHNAHFDISFLNMEIRRVFGTYRLGNPHLCTVQLSRRLLPQLMNHRLHTIAEHYGITIKNRHRAADDALATAKIFINFLDSLKYRGASDFASVNMIRA